MSIYVSSFIQLQLYSSCQLRRGEVLECSEFGFESSMDATRPENRKFFVCAISLKIYGQQQSLMMMVWWCVVIIKYRGERSRCASTTPVVVVQNTEKQTSH